MQQELAIPLQHKWAIRAEEREGQNGDTITWHGKEQEEEQEAASTSITLGYSLTNTGPSKAPALSKVWIQILC